MQTLGLSSQPQPADNILKRLFWPSIESQYDVDLLGQQGFYVCVAVAALSFLLLSFMGMPVTGLFTAVVYFLAGCGVRERSVGAAAMAVALYLANFLASIVLGAVGNPLLPAVILMLLFANLRATLLSRRWSAEPSGDFEFNSEDRSAATFLDRFSNRLPGKIWPKGKYAFFPLAGLLLFLTVAGLLLIKRAAARTAPPSSAQSLEVR